MPKSCCIICSAVASPDLQIRYCMACQSAMYCSRACQRKDWKKRHRGICKLLNVGHGDMQVHSHLHTDRSTELKELFEREKRSLEKVHKRFFKLFQKSTKEGSEAAAREMKKIARRQTKHNREFLLFHSLYFLVHFSNSEMLSWPSSPLLVLLQFVDPTVLSGTEDAPLQEDESRETPLHNLADLADHFDYSTHENQLILARQLIEHGAKVNAVSIPHGETPLHKACFWGNVTNLDFVELLFEEGADSNAQDHLGHTPLLHTTKFAPGAAKFLLNWPTTDANITTRSGSLFLRRVRKAVEEYSGKAALPDNPDRIQHQFLLQQWREIEEMAVEKGTTDTGIRILE